ncbi:unnamed protein product [Acanthoscelides obtectus]|uniref:Uncharacterized protein n=1 Tax=Acanthoscelides obtectus TaxID=200917 RepID=A0A9P0Q7L7_ACAOB|nr:unnamed protein product [Acanthoscelides obtectus]CAK1659911.1 hypothetical protein AOBTE_LOCUS21747 [Acanthoscelides obtectus]
MSVVLSAIITKYEALLICFIISSRQTSRIQSGRSFCISFEVPLNIEAFFMCSLEVVSSSAEKLVSSRNISGFWELSAP